MVKKYTLITGATAGIGWELARIIAQEGRPLILVARDEQRLTQRQKELQQQYSTPVEVLAKDLSICGAGAQLYEDVLRQRWEVDTLINNAGFGLVGHFLHTDEQREQQMVHLNVMALQELTKLFARNFQRQGGGRILNVASTAAYLPGPYMAVYYATKAFVLSFSEALFYELRPHGITVTTLVPGPTATEFQKRAGLGKVKLTRFLVMMDAASVARAGYKGLQQGKRVVIPGVLNKLSVWSLRFMPRALAAQMIGWLQQ